MKEFVLSMIDEADANSDTVIDKIPEPNVIEEKVNTNGLEIRHGMRYTYLYIT